MADSRVLFVRGASLPGDVITLLTFGAPSQAVSGWMRCYGNPRIMPNLAGDDKSNRQVVKSGQ
jgi:hypothetical protein